ncbi:MAG: FimV/HubP family polar landmark protein [Castellaniella sp.]
MKPAARLLSGVLTLAAFAAGSVQAASIGHARLASASGQPLLILVPVQGLSDADIPVLSAKPAPAADWTRVGLTPPVALNTLSVGVTPGSGGAGQRVLKITSPQLFSGSLADLLLDVQTASGHQRYQVSLLAPAPLTAQAPAGQSAPVTPAASASTTQATPATSVRRVPQGSIRVRKGDTMFAIARRHAVDGVSVYQLMMALQRANPSAFIQHNINLVRAGAQLAVPDVAEMLSISDIEARRQFVAQTAALSRSRHTVAAQAASSLSAAVSTNSTSGKVSPPNAQSAQSQQAAQDQLRLSQGSAAKAGASGNGGSPDQKADAQTADRHAQADAASRVGQLEDNVHNLNQALQAQGEAARSAAAAGAEAITQSIQQVASAITEASQDAAAQANASTQAGADGSATSDQQTSSPTAASDSANPQHSGQGGSTSPGQAAPADAGKAQSAAPDGSNTSLASGASGSDASGSSASNSAAGGSSASGASTGGMSTNAPVAANLASTELPEGAAAEAAELASTAQAQDRASWIQDHLLAVMTALLALIVFIIAWLLRRASAGRDDVIIESAQPTEAMVREKLQGLDLELSQEEPNVPPKG